MTKPQHSSDVFPIATLAFFVLLVLKVSGLINIPWLWVFSPYWIPIVGFGAIVVIAGAIAGVAIAGAYVWDHIAWAMLVYKIRRQNKAIDKEHKHINGKQTNTKTLT